MNDFDRFVDELQRQIEEQERAVYSPQVIEHARNPHNIGRPQQADGYAAITGSCGDTMEIYLRLGEGGTIGQVHFMTDGCGPAVACGSMMSVLAQGMSPEKALLISVQELICALGGLPAGSVHCAQLTVNTLRAAVADLANV